MSSDGVKELCQTDETVTNHQLLLANLIPFKQLPSVFFPPAWVGDGGVSADSLTSYVTFFFFPHYAPGFANKDEKEISQRDASLHPRAH